MKGLSSCNEVAVLSRVTHLMREGGEEKTSTAKKFSNRRPHPQTQPNACVHMYIYARA